MHTLPLEVLVILRFRHHPTSNYSVLDKMCPGGDTQQHQPGTGQSYFPFAFACTDAAKKCA